MLSRSLVRSRPPRLPWPSLHHAGWMPHYRSAWNKPVASANVAAGRFLLAFCLANKVSLAVPLVPLVAAWFDHAPAVGAAHAWLSSIAYALQIYFDFCGYSTMALGLALMLGFHFPQNFNHPYIAQSLTYFCRRCHMSPPAWFPHSPHVPPAPNPRGPLHPYPIPLPVLPLSRRFALCGPPGAPGDLCVPLLVHGVHFARSRLGLGAPVPAGPIDGDGAGPFLLARLHQHSYRVGHAVSPLLCGSPLVPTLGVRLILRWVTPWTDVGSRSRPAWTARSVSDAE